MERVHPTISAGQKVLRTSKDIPDSQGEKGNESRWVTCRQCGWPCDPDLTSDGTGWGNDAKKLTTGTTRYEPDETNPGCPLCHSSSWR